MTKPSGTPSDWSRVSDLLNRQPLEVSNLVCYLLVMSMADQGRAKILRAHVEWGRHYLILRTKAGEVFGILRPPISMRTELRMREEVKAIIEKRDD